jgi:hypothetical protein
MIDLAGSERAKKAKTSKKQLREGAQINRSLLALANCINALGLVITTSPRTTAHACSCSTCAGGEQEGSLHSVPRLQAHAFAEGVALRRRQDHHDLQHFARLVAGASTMRLTVYCTHARTHAPEAHPPAALAV